MNSVYGRRGSRAASGLHGGGLAMAVPDMGRWRWQKTNLLHTPNIVDYAQPRGSIRSKSEGGKPGARGLRRALEGQAERACPLCLGRVAFGARLSGRSEATRPAPRLTTGGLAQCQVARTQPARFV